MHQCDAVEGGCSNFVLNITMKKLLFVEDWSVQHKWMWDSACDRYNTQELHDLTSSILGFSNNNHLAIIHDLRSNKNCWYGHVC